MPDLRVALVEDHPLFRDALSQALRTSEIEIVGIGSLDELLVRLEHGLEVDALMLDLGLPGLNGLLGLLLVRSTHPEIPVIINSAREDPASIASCLQLGAVAYVPKSQPATQIRAALQTVMAGGTWLPEDYEQQQSLRLRPEAALDLSRLTTLTRRETEVLLKLAQGLLNKQIAHALGISEATVKAHLSRVLEKLKVSSRTQAVLLLQRLEGGMMMVPDVPDGSG